MFDQVFVRPALPNLVAALEGFAERIGPNAKGLDPGGFRRDLLAKAPRHLAVLNACLSKAQWNTDLPAGRFRGVAVHEGMGTFCALVAEITVFGLSAALKQEITLVAGTVQQTNFHHCDLLRIHECPEIDVTIVPSTNHRPVSANR